MSAVASRTAAVRARTSRSLRLREGSTLLMLALAGMPLARPRSEEEEEARVAGGTHLVGGLRLEVGDEAGPTGDRGAVLLDLDLARRHDEPGTLVDLVLLEPLPGRKVEGDHARLGVAAKHLRLVRFNVDRGDVPGLHAREDTSAGRGPQRAVRRSTPPPAIAASPTIAIRASWSPVKGRFAGPASSGRSTAWSAISTSVGAASSSWAATAFSSEAAAARRRGFAPAGRPRVRRCRRSARPGEPRARAPGRRQPPEREPGRPGARAAAPERVWE